MKSKLTPNSENTTTYTEKQFEHFLRLAANLQNPHSDNTAASDREEETDSRYRESLASDQVARRAFQLYLQRGASHGCDMADWLQAEEELRQKQERDKNIRRLALSWGLIKNSSEGMSSPG